MSREMHYRMAFRQGGIGAEDADRYISALKDETLDQITAMGFDRRLIKPILEVASKEVEKDQGTQLDDIVKEILGNKVRMFTFMRQFCLY